MSLSLAWTCCCLSSRCQPVAQAPTWAGLPPGPCSSLAATLHRLQLQLPLGGWRVLVPPGTLTTLTLQELTVMTAGNSYRWSEWCISPGRSPSRQRQATGAMVGVGGVQMRARGCLGWALPTHCHQCRKTLCCSTATALLGPGLCTGSSSNSGRCCNILCSSRMRCCSLLSSRPFPSHQAQHLPAAIQPVATSAAAAVANLFLATAAEQQHPSAEPQALLLPPPRSL